MLKSSCFSPFHIFIATIDGMDYKVPHIMGDREFEQAMSLAGGYMPGSLRAYHFTNMDMLLLNSAIEKFPIREVPVTMLFSSRPIQPMKLSDKLRKKTYPIKRKYGDYILCESEIGDRFYYVDGGQTSIITGLNVRPITLKAAGQYVKKYHRHCGAPKFHKFSICLTVAGEPEPVGVAIASTPKARMQMDGITLEINRVCSDPRYSNACSKLYAHAVRAGREMGYRRFISYTLPQESGSSLKAAGFRFDGMTQASKNGWSTLSRPRSTEKYPPGEKLRWILEIAS